MKIKDSNHNIILVKADTQYELSSTFWRLQEFYESPKFQNKYFKLEEYMDWYAEKHGNFTYFDDWNGFNVPGHIVQKFVKNAPYEFFEKEKKLFEMIRKYIEGDDKFYLIGVHTEDATLNHEYSHAFYHLFSDYKKEMEKLVKVLPKDFKTQIFNYLKKDGYHKSVFVDECIAYLSTNDMPYTQKMAENLTVPWEIVLKFQEKFQKYKKNKIG